MRKLMWFVVGFSGAVALAAYLLPVRWLLASALILMLPMLVLFFRAEIACKVIAVVLLGAITGMLYYAIYDSLLLSPIKSYDGLERELTVEATDYAFETDYGYAVDGTAELEGKTCQVRLYFGEGEVKPGDRIRGTASLRYTPAGGEKPATYHKGEGVFLLAYARDSVTIEPAENVPARYFAAQLRETISQRITALFPEDTAGFAKALLLGDDSDIGYGEDLSYQKSGIRHIIAVSGLHVSILFSLVYFVSNKRNLPTLLLGFPVLFLFCALAGFTPSIVRACIMQALMMVSMITLREYDQGTSLAFAALVILVINPLAITSVSFQLSVGSILGIFLFYEKIYRYLLDRKIFKRVDKKSRLGKGLCRLMQSFSVTVSAMTVTLPLCAWYFGMVSIVGILSNLLTLWLVSYIFYGIMLACVCSVAWMPAGVLIGSVTAWAIRYIQNAARLLSRIPGGVAYTDSPYTVLWLLSAFALVVLFLTSKRKVPLLLAGAISVLYGLSLFATWLEPYTDHVRMTVLDVGQGQCVLLQSRDRAYLLDCGGESPEQVADAAVAAMGAQGLQGLDGIILTHFDKDHANGAEYLLQAVPVARLYLPDTEPDSEIRMALQKQSVPITWVEERETLSCGVGELTIYPAEKEEEGNESSMCILYRGENCAILITGDRDVEGESLLLKQEHIPKLDVLVVGHHGAHTSTGWDLLKQTQPRLAIISVGENNIHSHPNGYTLDRLRRFGCIVRRTDNEGTIIIRG